jgi:hypothetical protein
MASQINVQITGKIQNLVFYKLGDKYYARSIPWKVKQTKATKKRATEFGKASRAGKCLRQQLMPCIPFPADNNMQTRLVSAIFQWLRSASYQASAPCDPVPFVSKFPFTEGYSVRERWKVPLEITPILPGSLEMKIPAFIPVRSISAPANTVSVECRISAGGCHIEKGMATGGFSTTLRFDYNDVEVPAQTIVMPLPTPQGSLMVTAVSLVYCYIKNGQLQKTANKAFMPANVIRAMYL